MGLSRRTFLAIGAGVVVGSGRAWPARAEPPLGADPFGLGVAAGDPDLTSAVLWTRLVGTDLPECVDVDYEVSTDETFATLVAGGRTAARAGDGHAVHVTVELAGRSWYRFRAGGFTSPIGRVAPTPQDTTGSDPLRIAATSCQHWETGYYAAHRDLAEWAPDLVVFLGDFIYEDAGLPVAPDRPRSHDAPEPTDLAGYRARYAQYLSDADLQRARAACPWVVIWDDHEVENNYAGLVPQDPAESAAFPARRDAAYRVWWEHMPVRLPPPVAGADYPIERVCRWGDLVDLVLVDGRQYRSDQACGDIPLSLDPPCAEAADPSRTMLGATQEAWLAGTLAEARSTWTALCQQTVLSDVRFNGAVLNYDQWDGYSPARDRLLADVAAAGVERFVVLTGDIHLAAVGVLPAVGVEFVTTSISSAGLVPADLQPVIGSFPAVVDVELAHRGYTRHTVTAEAWTAEYRIVTDVTHPDSSVTTWRTFSVDATSPTTVTPS